MRKVCHGKRPASLHGDCAIRRPSRRGPPGRGPLSADYRVPCEVAVDGHDFLRPDSLASGDRRRLDGAAAGGALARRAPQGCFSQASQSHLAHPRPAGVTVRAPRAAGADRGGDSSRDGRAVNSCNRLHVVPRLPLPARSPGPWAPGSPRMNQKPMMRPSLRLYEFDVDDLTPPALRSSNQPCRLVSAPSAPPAGHCTSKPCRRPPSMRVR